MFYSIFPDKDATLYEISSSQNTGLDEILELKNTQAVAGGATVPYNSRILLKFDVTAVSQSIVDGDINSNAKFYLRLSFISCRANFPGHNCSWVKLFKGLSVIFNMSFKSFALGSA